MPAKKKNTSLPSGLKQPLNQFAGHKVQRLLGFCWTVHSLGGIENVAAQPFWTEGSVYRWRAEFREVFGVEVENYLPEVAPVLQAAYYGEGNSYDSPAGKAKQDQAAADLKAKKSGPKQDSETLHEVLGTVEA
jgi:hypothetical protein